MVSSQLACLCLFFFSVFPHVTMLGGRLRRVFVLLCAAAAKIHPTQVVPVCYPMVGAQSDASVVCRVCRVPAHGTWEEKQKSDEGEQEQWGGGGGCRSRVSQ